MPLKDLEERKTYNRARYLKDRAKYIARAVAYALANPERVRETRQQRYRKNPAKVLSKIAEWRAANPEKVKKTQREASRKYQYGITAEQVGALLGAQGGKCAISTCRTDLTMVGRGGDVDHDHVTGVVRGLLCHACNVGLGQFNDDPAKLIAAADYLRKPFPVLLRETHATTKKSSSTPGAPTTAAGVPPSDAR